MKAQVNVSAFQFKRSKLDGRVHILNDRSYIMGIYNQRTGKIIWERVVLATQRENIETWLLEHYPILAVA